jgi:hypothetical protein
VIPAKATDAFPVTSLRANVNLLDDGGATPLDVTCTAFHAEKKNKEAILLELLKVSAYWAGGGGGG